MAVNFSYTSPQTQKTKLKFQVGKDISSTTDTTTKDRVLAKRSSQNRIAANLESPRASTHKKAAQESSAKAKKPTVVRPEDTQKRVAGVETDEVLYKSLSKRTSSFQMCNCKEEEAEAARIAKQLANVERDVEDHQHPEKEYSQVCCKSYLESTDSVRFNNFELASYEKPPLILSLINFYVHLSQEPWLQKSQSSLFLLFL
jgi:hypothetical protein